MRKALESEGTRAYSSRIASRDIKQAKSAVSNTGTELWNRALSSFGSLSLEASGSVALMRCWFWFFVGILLSLSCAGLDELILEKDLYGVLGVTKEATNKEIKKAYRALAQIHHPDKVAAGQKDINADIFREIAQAYEILIKTETREEYDLSLIHI